jgi:hypothetical protein
MENPNFNPYPSYQEVLDVLWPEDMDPYTYRPDNLQLWHFLPNGVGPHAGKPISCFCIHEIFSITRE